MSPWLIEFFGSRELNRAFLMLLSMTAPVWVLLLLPGRPAAARRLSSPYFFPVLMVPVWVYMAYTAYTLSRLPVVASVDYNAARSIARHPLLLLLFICHIQILNLFLGCAIFRDALKRRTNPTAALLLTWVTGPPGLLVYALQRLIRR